MSTISEQRLQIQMFNKLYHDNVENIFWHIAIIKCYLTDTIFNKYTYLINQFVASHQSAFEKHLCIFIHKAGRPSNWKSLEKNRVRFGATVTFNEPYVAQSCQAFQRKMSIEPPSIHPRYLFGRQPTPDLRFNQKPFGIPSRHCCSYLRFQRERRADASSNYIS